MPPVVKVTPLGLSPAGPVLFPETRQSVNVNVPALKIPPPAVNAGAAEAFRTRVKAVELEAERLQQQTMYELAPALQYEPGASVLAAARASVAAYAAISSRPFPPAAVETILGALEKFSGEPDRSI